MQGYFGGAVDLGLQRFIEIWEGLPVLYLLIILATFVEPNFWWLLGLMLLFSWTSLVGVVRAEFLRARNFDYVRAARALGVSDPVIIIRHVLPNATVATITFLPFILNGSITTLTSLDFLGFGLPPGSASLGELLAQGKANLQAPWLGITAFLVLALMLSLLIFIGEAVRDAFDPRKVQPVSLLEVRDLSVTFAGWRGAPPVEAVKRISFTLDRGETLALVGESGSGKIGDSAVGPAAPPLPRRRPHPRKQHPLCRRGDGRRRSGAAARDARQPHRDDLPGADDLAQPAAHAGKAGRRDAPDPQAHGAGGGARPHPRTAASRRPGATRRTGSMPIRTSSRAVSASGS